MIGIELIAKERQEQIEKHGRSIKRDVIENRAHQLATAASFLCLPDTGCETPDEFCETYLQGWSEEIFAKMADKEYKDRLIIAGALIAAELDRLLNDPENPVTT